MKQVEAIIKPFQLGEVQEALTKLTTVEEVIRIRTGEKGADAI